jgi:hypothetical protein
MFGYRGNYILAVVCLATGAFFGSIGMFGSIKVNAEINILDALSLCATLLIAFLIPTTVKKILDDNRSVKILLVEETQDLLSLSKAVYAKINNFYTSEKQMTGADKDAVIEAFYTAELKMDSIREQFDVSYPDKTLIHEDITIALLKYKSFVTGGIFMNSKYIEIDHNFFMENKSEFSEFEKHVMTKVHKIHKF